MATKTLRPKADVITKIEVPTLQVSPFNPRHVKPVENENKIILKGCAKHARFYAGQSFLNKLLAAKIKGFHFDVEIKALNEFDFREYKNLKKRENSKIVDALFPSCIIEIHEAGMNGKPATSRIVNLAQLMEYIKDKFGFQGSSIENQMTSKAEYKRFLKSNKNPLVYLNIGMDDTPVGRLVLELYQDTCPKTVEQFLGFIQKSNGEHSYKDTQFTRLVADGWIEGGEIREPTGEPITSPLLEDENFIVPHDHRGIVSFVNSGPHSNCSSFLILLASHMSYFDRKYVAFGRIIDGEETLEKMENVETRFERPVKKLTITDCGMLSEILDNNF